MPRYTQAEIREFEQMQYKQQHKDDKPTHLETPIDLVVVDRQSRKVESITVWQNLTDIGRIERLQRREQVGYGAEVEIVAVEARSVGLGDIITSDKTIEL